MNKIAIEMMISVWHTHKHTKQYQVHISCVYTLQLIYNIIMSNFYCSTFLLLIKRLLRLAGGSSISQLVADYMSFSEAKLGIITDATPSIVVVDLDPSRGI